jgi:hypothetical protein
MFVGTMLGLGAVGVIIRAPIMVLGATILFLAYVFAWPIRPKEEVG